MNSKSPISSRDNLVLYFYLPLSVELAVHEITSVLIVLQRKDAFAVGQAFFELSLVYLELSHDLFRVRKYGRVYLLLAAVMIEEHSEPLEGVVGPITIVHLSAVSLVEGPDAVALPASNLPLINERVMVKSVIIIIWPVFFLV